MASTTLKTWPAGTWSITVPSFSAVTAIFTTFSSAILKHPQHPAEQRLPYRYPIGQLLEIHCIRRVVKLIINLVNPRKGVHHFQLGFCRLHQLFVYPVESPYPLILSQVIKSFFLYPCRIKYVKLRNGLCKVFCFNIISSPLFYLIQELLGHLQRIRRNKVKLYIEMA